MMLRSSARTQDWDVSPIGPSRLPKFVQVRSAQHRLRKLGTLPGVKPTAVVKPIESTIAEAAATAVSHKTEESKSFKKYEWSEHVTKLDKILETEDVPDKIKWNPETAALFVEENTKMHINRLEYQMNQLDNQLRKQDVAFKTTSNDLNKAAEFSDILESNNKSLQNLLNKTKEAHFESELQLCAATKSKTQLETLLDKTKIGLEQETLLRTQLECDNKRLENDLKISAETSLHVEGVVKELERNLSTKQEEFLGLVVKLEKQQNLVAQLQQEIKSLQQKLSILEKNLEKERISREAFESSEADLRNDLENLAVKYNMNLLDIQVQEEKIAAKEREIERLKKQLIDVVGQHDVTMSALKAKFTDQILSLNDRLTALHREKTSLDNSLIDAKHKNDELNNELETAYRFKRKLEAQKNKAEAKSFERELRLEQQNGLMAEFTGQKFRLISEKDKLCESVRKYEYTIKDLSSKQQAADRQVNVLELSLNECNEHLYNVKGKVNELLAVNSTLTHKLTESDQYATLLASQISRLNDERQNLLTKLHEAELANIEQLEQQKKTLERVMQHMEEEKEALDAKVISLENIRSHLLTDIKDLQDSLETTNNKLTLAGQKIKDYEKSTAELNKNLLELTDAFKNAERENHSLAKFSERLQENLSEAEASIAKLVSENDQIRNDIRNLNDELAHVAQKAKETENNRKRLAEENLYIQKRLDASENDVVDRDEKIAQLKIEILNFDSVLRQRLAEQTAEFEVVRKFLKKNIEDLNVTLEIEISNKDEAVRQEKILVKQLEQNQSLLDYARQYTEEAKKMARKFQDHNMILTKNLLQSSDRCRMFEQKLEDSNRRVAFFEKQCEEFSLAVKNLEGTNNDLNQKVEDVSGRLLEKEGEVQFVVSEKQRVEKDLLDLTAEFASLNDQLGEVIDEMGHVKTDMQTLKADLVVERQNVTIAKTTNLHLEARIQDLQDSLERAERDKMQAVEKAVASLRHELLEAQSDLTSEKRSHEDTRKREQHVKKQLTENQFLLHEEKKRAERMSDLVETLENKMSAYRQQREEAETVSKMNYTRCKALGTELSHTSERADLAESVLNRIRMDSKMRHLKSDVDVSYHGTVSNIKPYVIHRV